MNLEQKIQKYMQEGNINSFFERAKGEFKNYLESSSVTSWGWIEPIQFEGQRIVFHQVSPAHKGCKSCCFYDFVSEKEYQKIF